MVVAASTADREPEECLACRPNDFVDRVGPNLCRLDRVAIAHIVVGSRDQKCRPDGHVRVVTAEHIASQVLANELIKRLVLVDRTNHVISKRPNVVDDHIPLIPNALTKTDDVQPVSPPTFAVMR